jgi:nucleoside-diphosphate-sugar epimerase
MHHFPITVLHPNLPMNLHPKTVLIPEVTECIGQRAALIALEKGMKVRGLVRSPAAAEVAKAQGIEVFVSDMLDAATLAPACEGVDIVINPPSSLVTESKTLDELRQISVTSAKAIAAAAQSAGAKCFVQISNVLVYGFQYADQVTESGPFGSGNNNPIGITQLEAEQAVMAFNTPEFGVTCLRAGDVYGPDSSPWVVRPIEMMKAGKFFLINNGKGIMNHVYVDNLIDAVWLSIEKEAYGEAFNITDGCRTSWKEYYSSLAKIAGMPAPTSVPALVAKAAVKLQSGKEGGVTLAAIEAVTRQHAYSIEKAKRVLGYQPRFTLEQGMAKTAAWLSDR